MGYKPETETEARFLASFPLYSDERKQYIKMKREGFRDNLRWCNCLEEYECNGEDIFDLKQMFCENPKVNWNGIYYKKKIPEYQWDDWSDEFDQYQLDVLFQCDLIMYS